MSSYTYNYTDYPNVQFQTAFDSYMNQNTTYYNGSGFSDSTFSIYTTIILTDDQVTQLITLITNYIAPPYVLIYNNSQSYPLHTHYNNDQDISYDSDNNSVVQLFIFNNNNSSTLKLDAFKTIIEYTTPNVQNYLNTTSGTLYFQIYDNTRDIIITETTIDISSYATQWNTLAQTGSTTSNTIYDTLYLDGMMNKTTDYDNVWMLKIKTSDSNYISRLHGMQHLYYDYISS